MSRAFTIFLQIRTLLIFCNLKFQWKIQNYHLFQKSVNDVLLHHCIGSIPVSHIHCLYFNVSAQYILLLKGAQWLKTASELCKITCEDGETYSFRTGLPAQLIEINEHLLENPSLLTEKVRVQWRKMYKMDFSTTILTNKQTLKYFIFCNCYHY